MAYDYKHQDQVRAKRVTRTCMRMNVFRECLMPSTITLRPGHNSTCGTLVTNDMQAIANHVRCISSCVCRVYISIHGCLSDTITQPDPTLQCRRCFASGRARHSLHPLVTVSVSKKIVTNTCHCRNMTTFLQSRDDQVLVVWIDLGEAIGVFDEITQ